MGHVLAEKRVALVIGNAAYQYTSNLKNPVNDAVQIAKSLQKMGFDVIHEVDLDAEQFAKVMARFSKKLHKADVALFYFAGHGLQFRGENYLVPIDAQLKNEFTLKQESFLATDIIEQMETQARVNLVFLDACRNNPLASSLRRSMSSTRSALLGPGLGGYHVSRVKPCWFMRLHQEPWLWTAKAVTALSPALC